MVYSAVDREEADRHFLRVLFFCNFWLLLFGFSDSLLFGWREAKTGNTSAFAGYPTAVTRQNRLRSRLPNWRMLTKTPEGVSDLLEDNSTCWRTSISRGTQQLSCVKYLLREANIHCTPQANSSGEYDRLWNISKYYCKQISLQWFKKTR